jgi:hypothetical protein
MDKRLFLVAGLGALAGYFALGLLNQNGVETPRGQLGSALTLGAAAGIGALLVDKVL